jgi:class 3 adenylate cyclase/tetratricopeptide (TPR) repeat protein
MAEARVERRLAAILAADIAGYSRLMGNDEEGTLAALKACRSELIDPKFHEHRGRVVKTTGDGALVEFASAVDAVRCAIEIQRAMAERNVAIPEDRRIEFRIGINVGDVIIDEDDIYGDGVNIAARVEALASPGAVCLSDNAYQQIKGKLFCDAVDMGERQLKNIAQPVRVYHVRSGDEAPHGPESLLASKPAVAVLPFTNQNRDPDEDYFADGISEDIITSLSKHRWLTVVARNSAFGFRNSADSIRTIGNKLSAQYIVTGTVRKAGARFRITIQLIDSATEHSIWSERFDRDMVDIFELQDEISGLVAARIEAELGLQEQRKASRRPRKNLGAWDLYQLGTAEFYKFTQESNLKCQEFLRQSIELDPEFAGAHSRLAYAIVLSMVYFDADPDNALLEEALAMAKRAVELDDQDANSYISIGRVHQARRDYDLAIEAAQYALELNPSLAVTYCALGDSLAYEGRYDEAIEQFEIAIKLSPHDPYRWGFYSYRSLVHLLRGDFEHAAFWARNAIRIPNVQYWARAHLVAALGHLGDQAQAAAAVRDLLNTKPGFSLDFARKHLFYLKRSDHLETYIEGLRKAGVR